jgi:ABC-type sugar transport system substrate-binding protein
VVLDRVAREIVELPAVGIEIVQDLGRQGRPEVASLLELTAMPDLGGIFFIGGWPLFGDVNAMPQFLAATAAGTLKAVSWDTLSMQLPLLEDGTVQGLIGQKYFGWGYDGIGIMYDIVKYGITVPDFIDSGYDLLTTPEQAVEFAKKWETQNFVPEGGSPFGKGDPSAYGA